MRREERVAVLAVDECRGTTCREESHILHAEEAKDRPQVGLDEVERCHLRLRIIIAAGRDNERGFLARDQAFGRSVRIGKGLADSRNLVDPELQHRGHTEVMHRDAEYVLIGLLQFGEERVRKRQHFLLLWSARLLRRVGGAYPFASDRWDRGGVEVAVDDGSIGVRSLPLGDERTGKLARDGPPIEWARVDM